MFGAALANAESRVVNATHDFVLFEFNDPFESGTLGYSISSNNIRFDKYDLGATDFISLTYNTDARRFIEETIERRFRSINPRYPSRCDDFAPESANGCEANNIVIRTKLSIRTDEKDIITICDHRLDGPFGNCTVGTSGFSCISGAGNAIPSKLRECVSDNLTEPMFFYPSDELSTYLTGERLYLRLELIETSNNLGSDGIDYQVLGQFDFPSDDLTRIERLFGQREQLALEAFSE